MQLSFRLQILIAAVGATVLAAVLLVTAGAANGTTALPSGGTYVEALVGAPRYVNPLLASSDTDTDLAHLVFSGLTRIASDGAIAPDLASRWDVSQDSRVFTFTLKPDARWQDGPAVTAADVLFTLDLVRRPDFPGDPALATPWKNVDVSSPNTQTVVFKLPASNASFLQYTTFGLLPKHLWGSVQNANALLASPLNQSPVGSGPWRYANATPVASVQPADTGGGSESGDNGATTSAGAGADGVLLERSPYVQASSSAISRLWFRPYPTFGAALTAFKAGEVHGLGHIPDGQIAEVAAVPGVQLHTQSFARYTMLIFNLQAPELDKAETRRAIALAIDRKALVRGSLAGLAEPAESPVLSGSWAYNPQAAGQVTYDPAEAGRLLEAAGWKLGADGIRIRNGERLGLVLTANIDLPQDVATAGQIAAALKMVGVEVKQALVSRDTLLNTYLAPGAFHMALTGWRAAGADPDISTYWHSAQGSAAGNLNFTGWHNPAADQALDAALATPDQSARAADYRTFQSLFVADTPGTILYSPLYTYATRAPAIGVTLPNAPLLTPAQRFDTMQGWSVAGSRW